MSNLSKIFILPETKQDIKIFVKSVKDNILEGNECPLLVLKKLKTLESVVKQLKDDPEIKESLLKESDKFAEKTIEIHGAKFSKQERATWDFSQCNDSVLDWYYKELKELTEKIKEREDFLKVLPKDFVNMETGEVLNPATKSSLSIIAVTL